MTPLYTHDFQAFLMQGQNLTVKVHQFKSTKETNICDFLLVSMDNKALPKQGLFLKDKKSNALHLELNYVQKGDKSENCRVASPQKCTHSP